MQQHLSVFTFLDYRDFLSAFYSLKKRTEYGFTYAKFSKLAGIKSPNYLKLIKEKKRNLTDKNIFKFANALKLNDNETQYFEHLVRYNQGETTESKLHHYRKLQYLLRNQEITPGNIRQSEQLFESFATFIIYEAIRMKNGKASIEWVQKNLNFYIPKSELKNIFKSLEDNQLITSKGDNLWKTEEFFLNVDREQENVLLADWHLSLIDQAKEAISTFDFDKRDMNAHTAVLDKEQFKDFCKEYHSLTNNLIKKYESLANNPATVVQICNQVFLALEEK